MTLYDLWLETTIKTMPIVEIICTFTILHRQMKIGCFVMVVVMCKLYLATNLMHPYLPCSLCLTLSVFDEEPVA